MDLDFTDSLRKASSVDEFLNIIDRAEADKDEAEDAKEKASADDEPGETLNLISGTFSEEFDDG